MLEDVKGRISGLKDEVKELHPLLDELFVELPEISGVAHTHGPDEMGADFVLTSTHNPLGETEYIGVVAKVGKIRQNFDDVERQIKECVTVRRKVENGKKEVVLSHVWVVCTGSISGNAREKIHALYPGTNVHFVDGDRLSKMVYEHMPFYGSGVSLPVGTYLGEVRARSEEMEKSGEVVQLEGGPIHIEQDVVRIEFDPYNPEKRRNKQLGKPKRVELTEEITKTRVLLVEADMGGGKSKLLRGLTRRYADAATFTETKVVPVNATFKELLDKHGGDLERLLERSVPRETRTALGTDAEYLFLIDAVDEKKLPPDELADAVNGVLDQVDGSRRRRLVLASRHVGSLDFDKRFYNRMGRYEIAPLTMGKIMKFVGEVCRRLNLQSRIIEDLRRSALFERLPKNPMAAVLLGHLLAENQQELPSTMTELYQRYVELALGRWDAWKGLQTQQEYETVENVLVDLAAYMLENDLEGMSAAEAKDRFADYLTRRNLKVGAEELFERATKRAEILSVSADGHSVWFKHRSFAEFLYAKWLRKQGQLRPDMRAFELYWTNTYFFGLGLERDAQDLLDGLIALSPEQEGHRWMKVINMGGFLMAAYQTPYEAIERGVYSAALEAAGLFKDVVEGNASRPLGGLTRMQLLYLLQLLMRDTYGYEFLAKALMEAAGRMLDGGEDSEKEAYAAFLIAVAYVDAAPGESLDWFLEAFKARLPLDVRLALWYEGDKLVARNGAMRKIRRNIESSLRSSQEFRDETERLFERPIAAALRQRGAGGSPGQAQLEGKRKP